MNVSKVLAALPKLKSQELATVRAAAEHLMGARGANTGDETAELYRVISSHLKVNLNFELFKSSNIFKTWKKTAPPAVQFLSEAFPTAGKVAMQALMSMLVETLIDNMRANSIPVTLGTVSAQVGRLPQVLESCFPNYIENGMASVILRAMEKRNG